MVCGVPPESENVITRNDTKQRGSASNLTAVYRITNLFCVFSFSVVCTYRYYLIILKYTNVLAL